MGSQPTSSLAQSAGIGHRFTDHGNLMRNVDHCRSQGHKATAFRLRAFSTIFSNFCVTNSNLSLDFRVQGSTDQGPTKIPVKFFFLVQCLNVSFHQRQSKTANAEQLLQELLRGWILAEFDGLNQSLSSFEATSSARHGLLPFQELTWP